MSREQEVESLKQRVDSLLRLKKDYQPTCVVFKDLFIEMALCFIAKHDNKNICSYTEIKTEKEHEKALKMLDEVFEAKEGTPEADKAIELAKAIEVYEDKYYPIKEPTEEGLKKFRVEQMAGPPHPGGVIKRIYFEPLEISVAKFAQHLGVSRKHVSELLNEKIGISPEMAVRLSTLFGTSILMWLNMWLDYSISQVDTSKIKVKPIIETKNE